jgi:isopentenyldiphosphate isomerase
VSLRERVEECRVHDLGRFLPLHVGGERVGWVRREAAPLLARLSSAFRVGPEGVVLDAGDDPGSRTEAVARVVPPLREEGWVGPDRGEPFPVLRAFGDPPLLALDRSVVPFFGVHAWGVHLNGWVRTPEGVRLWVARRAMDRLQSPGKWDHLVAGGQPLGLSFEDNLVKECGEEAGIPPALARRAVRAPEFSYRFEVRHGLRDDTLVVYDLELPPDFRPANRDGEVESFALWPPERVLEVLRHTREFKYNVAPVVLGFLVRRGLVPADDPELAALRGLLDLG